MRDPSSWSMVTGGAVATGYGLTLLLIALVIITAAAAFGIAVRGLFEHGPPALPAP